MKEYLTTKQLSARIQMAPGTIRNLIWKKDLGAYETQSDWGTSTSPVLYKNTLYLQLDNEVESFLVAMDKKTGEEIWRIPREEKTNWSTPVIWQNRVRTELFMS